MLNLFIPIPLSQAYTPPHTRTLTFAALPVAHQHPHPHTPTHTHPHTLCLPRSLAPSLSHSLSLSRAISRTQKRQQRRVREWMLCSKNLVADSSMRFAPLRSSPTPCTALPPSPVSYLTHISSLLLLCRPPNIYSQVTIPPEFPHELLPPPGVSRSRCSC
jgi:hypothetical protein